MSDPVLLNNVDHHDVRVLTGHGAAFGDNINQVTVLPTEYEALQRDYRILPVRVRKETRCALMWLRWSHCPLVEANFHKTSWPNGSAPAGLGHVRATISEHATVTHLR